MLNNVEIFLEEITYFFICFLCKIRICKVFNYVERGKNLVWIFWLFMNIFTYYL